MLRLFRASAVAAMVAGLTVVGIVGGQVANADPITREQLLEMYPDVKVLGDVPENHRDAYKRLVVYPRMDEAQRALAPSPLMQLTGTEVKLPGPSGPVVGNLCKSGYGCVVAGLAATGLAAAGLLGLIETPVDVETPELDPAGVYDLAKHPAQMYPSVASNKCITGPTLTGVSVEAMDVTLVPDSQYGCTDYAKVSYAVDCRRPDGSLGHFNGQITTVVGTSSYRALLCSPGEDVHQIHFDQDTTNWSGWGTTSGFYWGRQLEPDGGTIRSETRCVRPDGSEYSVLSTPLPIGLGSTNVAPCNAGDEPIWVQTDHITPGGTVVPQSVQNLQRDLTPPEWAPDCKIAGSGCRWLVKVDNVPCTVGMAGCTDWAEMNRDVSCWYGPYPMPIEACYMLERAYEPHPSGTRVPQTKRNTDGKPETHDGPAPVRTPTTTTQPSPTASPSPSPSPSTPRPTPTTAPTTPPTPSVCTTSYSLGPVQSEAVVLANDVGSRFDLDTIYGWKDPAKDNYGEHSSGLALDFMVGSNSAKGEQVAQYLQDNARALGVRWIIWEQHVWNVERASEGWRLMEDRGNSTANHEDHVHVLLADTDPTGESCSGDPADPAAGGGCLSKAVSWNPVDWVYWPVRCTYEWAFIPPGGPGFFNDTVNDLAAEFRASPVGSWWTLLGDVGNSIENLDGSGQSGFQAARAASSAPDAPAADVGTFMRSSEPDTYDGARLMAAVPMVQDPGPAIPPASSAVPLDWSTGGGALCQGPGVSMQSIRESMGGMLDRVPAKIYPFDACSGVMAKVAATSKIVITAMVGYTVLMTCLRQLGSAFGINISGGEMSSVSKDVDGPDPAHDWIEDGASRALRVYSDASKK